ncbi:MAG TPA: hypothetical protein PKA33_17800 [Amaricoccus sp.]|uniref:hypothetical protein n=1 Tax=Amaricoccus sp. TaxID=1872485 RepID=UPI002BF91D32|nr:hypothetical protein [Amaricoccus sp.]HMQ92849.1 hypothetical protein [Amaricoccus sp.]HMR37047.1 hypothetical protein [Paracoccus sp. (in: a-proteobacteria)]HMR54169.1 hypothetical protein [Amaricoccus sp.]HMU01202.1 hypothetical protein [Amaricoccus sp.]
MYGARYYDGQGIGVIPMVPAADVDLGERQPGENENYLSADFFALIRSNHVICLNCGRNGGALRGYLAMLFAKAEMPNEVQQFELIRVANPNTLAIIEAVGVKRVNMKVSITEAAAVDLIGDAPGGGLWQDAKRRFGEAFRGLTERDEELGQLRQAERGSVTVSINVEKGDLAVAKEGLDHLAAEIAEDEDAEGYVIELRNNTTIKPNEVSSKKTVRIDAHANSVSPPQAWDAMREYMGELVENGQIEV